MPVPIICLDDQVRQFAERFREQFSKPRFKYFVIVLLGLLRMSREHARSSDYCGRWPMRPVCQD